MAARWGVSIDYVELLDTTLRDGAQSRGVSFTLHDKLRIAELLDEFGIDIIEAGWPGSNPKDSEFFKAAKQLSLTHSRLAAFGSTRRRDLKVGEDPSIDAILRADVGTAVIFGKSWLLHVHEVLRCGAEENVEIVRETVEYLREHGLEVIFDAEHFFDGWRDSPKYAMSVVKAAEEAGSRVVVLCDTNGGSLTSEIREVVRRVRRELSAPLGIHTHNDAGLAVANSLTAVEEGARHVQGTINGLGERCGNADLIQIIPSLALKMRMKVLGGAEEKLRMLTRVAMIVAELSNIELKPNHPYVGKHAFAHKGGVHIDAMMKNPRTYEHIEPSLVGNERLISVSELAGRAALLAQAKKLGLGLSKAELGRALEEVKRMEAEGYHLEPADATVSLIILRSMGRLPVFFKIRTWWVETFDIGRITARAIVSIDVNGEAVTAMGEGVGPVHALDEAIKAAVSKKFPELIDTRLVNYKVTVVDSADGTAAAVRVFVEFAGAGSEWATTAVSKNIVEASLKAIIDGYVYRLAVLGKDVGEA